jgi:hypothetical protein
MQKIALIGHEECSKENLASSRITYHGLSADPVILAKDL